MEENVSKLIQSLGKDEIETLLDIYYNREGFEEASFAEMA